MSGTRSTARIKPIASTGNPIAVRIMAMAAKLADGCNQRQHHNQELLHETKLDAMGLGNEHGRDTLVQNRAIHVDGGAERQHKTTGAIRDPGIFLHALHGERQRGRGRAGGESGKQADAMARKWRNGLTRPIKNSSSGNTREKCSDNATSTLIKNHASGTKAETPVLATTLATSPNTPMGANFIAQSVIFIVT